METLADNTVTTRIPPQLIRSDTHGKGAAEIGWGSPGDFDRCHRFAAAHGIPKHMRDGFCANLHKLATGEWPGVNAHKGAHALQFLIAAMGKGFQGRRWSGPLAPIGTPTGDGRIFPPNTLKYQTFPMPLGWQEHSGRGHDGAVTVGVIEHAEERMHNGKPIVWAQGYLLDPNIIPEVMKAEHLIEHGVAGASVDLDSYTAALRPGEDGKHLQTLKEGRMRSSTIVRIPAFADLRLQFDDEEPETVTAAIDGVEDFSVNGTGWKGAPVAPREAEFDADDAVSRIEAWAGQDRAQLDKMFLWVNPNGQALGRDGYKLPWGDIIDGKPYLIYHAVYAAAALLSGAHGGLPNIPDEDKAHLRGVITQIYNHLATELDDPSIRAPWDRRPDSERVAEAALVSAVGAALEEFRDMPGGRRQPRVPGVPGARRSRHIDNPHGGEFEDVPGRGPHGQVKVGNKWVYPAKGAKNPEASARAIAKKGSGKTVVAKKSDIDAEREADRKRAAHLREVAAAGSHRPEPKEEKKPEPKPEKKAPEKKAAPAAKKAAPAKEPEKKAPEPAKASEKGPSLSERLTLRSVRDSGDAGLIKSKMTPGAKEHADDLVDRGLLEQRTRGRYHVTDKGRAALEGHESEEPEKKAAPEKATSADALRKERDQLGEKLMKINDRLESDRRVTGDRKEALLDEHQRVSIRLEQVDRQLEDMGNAEKKAPEPTKGRGHIGEQVKAAGTHDEGRTRQHHVDRARAVAEMASAMDELDFNENTLDESKKRMASMAERFKGEPGGDDLAELNDKLQAAKTTAEMSRIANQYAESHGLSRSGRAGQVTPFDRTKHQRIGSDDHRPGEKVEIVRPGYTLNDGEKDITLRRPIVDSAEGGAPADTSERSHLGRRPGESETDYRDRIRAEGRRQMEEDAKKTRQEKSDEDVAARKKQNRELIGVENPWTSDEEARAEDKADAAEAKDPEMTDDEKLKIRRDVLGNMLEPEQKKVWDGLSDEQKDRLIDQSISVMHEKEKNPGGRIAVVDAKTGKEVGGKTVVAKKEHKVTPAQQKAIEALKADPNAKIHPATRKVLERENLIPKAEAKKPEAAKPEKPAGKTVVARGDLTDAQQRNLEEVAAREGRGEKIEAGVIARGRSGGKGLNVATLRRLEDRGLIERRDDEGNKVDAGTLKTSHYFLTPKGREHLGLGPEEKKPAKEVGVSADSVEKALGELHGDSGDRDYVSLTELRKKIGGTREQQDRVLTEMARDRRIHAVGEENQQTLTKQDRADALVLGGEPKHVIRLTKAKPTAEPSARSETPAPKAEKPTASQAKPGSFEVTVGGKSFTRNSKRPLTHAVVKYNDDGSVYGVSWHESLAGAQREQKLYQTPRRAGKIDEFRGGKSDIVELPKAEASGAEKRAGKTVVAKAAPAKESQGVKEQWKKFDALESRDKAREMVKDLPKRDLVALADEGDVPYRKSDTAEQLRNTLIRWAGTREDSNAILNLGPRG